MSKIPTTPLSRQHFEYLAWCVGNIKDQDYFVFTREWLAVVLDATNPYFDSGRWISRCDFFHKEAQQ